MLLKQRIVLIYIGKFYIYNIKLYNFQIRERFCTLYQNGIINKNIGRQHIKFYINIWWKAKNRHEFIKGDVRYFKNEEYEYLESNILVNGEVIKRKKIIICIKECKFYDIKKY